MRSVHEDLTTRARIRDAAVRLYGHDGFARTTVRAVAAAAGVSPALVIHHFGSKAGLRLACDEHVLSHGMRTGQRKATPAGLRGLIEAYLADPQSYRADLDYIGRSLTDPSDAGDVFFDAMVGTTREALEQGIADGTIRAFDDVHAVAVLLTTHSAAHVVLRSHLARNLGTADLDAAFLRRITVPAMDLYTNGVYTDDRLLAAARATLAGPVGAPSPEGGEGTP